MTLAFDEALNNLMAGSTKGEAEQSGMKACATAKSMANCESDGNPECRIYYKGCSTPPEN
jgi:hypothetical protein